MGVAIFDILREHGAYWVNCTGDFTKRVTKKNLQIFLTLSPDGTEFISCYDNTNSLDCFTIDHLTNLPVGLNIPENISHEEVIAKMKAKYPWLYSENIFEIINKRGKRIAFTYVRAGNTPVIYGMLNGEDYFTP